MRWEDEGWVKLYTRDTADWQLLSFEAQGLFLLLLKKANRAGIVDLGRRGRDAIGMAVGHPGATERLKAPLQELLDDGCLVIKGATLVLRNFVEAQKARTSDAQRQRKKRQQDRDLALSLSHDVTRGHTASRSDKTRSDQKRSDQRKPPPTPSAENPPPGDPEKPRARVVVEMMSVLDVGGTPISKPISRVEWEHCERGLWQMMQLERELVGLEAEARPKAFEAFACDALSYDHEVVQRVFRAFLRDKGIRSEEHPTRVFIGGVWTARRPVALKLVRMVEQKVVHR